MSFWLTFQLNDENYACRLQTIKEVVRFKEPVPVPGASNLVDGILNLRGEIVPVVSAINLLKLEDEAAAFILVREFSSGLMGIPVSDLGEIILIDESKIESTNSQESVVLGTAQTEIGLVILTNFKSSFFMSESG